MDKLDEFRNTLKLRRRLAIIYNVLGSCCSVFGRGQLFTRAL